MYVFGRVREAETPGSKKVFIYKIETYNEEIREVLRAATLIKGALTDYLQKNHLEPMYVACVDCVDGSSHLEIFEGSTSVYKPTDTNTSYTAHMVSAFLWIEKKAKEADPQAIITILNE